MHDKNSVSCDTDLFSTIPAYARYYAIPYEQTRQGIQKKGRHAAVHQWALSEACQIDERCKRRLITVFMGDQTNIVAFNKTEVLATSDGFSSTDGIVSSTGAGAIDTAIVFQLCAAKKSFTYIHDLLSQESGFCALAGGQHTLVDILSRQDEKARCACEIYSYQVLKAIGAFVAILGGLDAIVFIGGPVLKIKELALDLTRQMKFLGLNAHPSIIDNEGSLLTSDDSLRCSHYFEYSQG